MYVAQLNLTCNICGRKYFEFRKIASEERLSARASEAQKLSTRHPFHDKQTAFTTDHDLLMLVLLGRVYHLFFLNRQSGEADVEKYRSFKSGVNW